MPTVEEIKKLKEHYVNDVYSGVREEQRVDDTFYKDIFPVPQISNPNRIQRTGRAPRLIDSPAEHIITSNPQVFRYPIKETKSSAESALKVSIECNRWVNILKRQNPNPYKEFVKNLLLRGEAWIHPVHNERWVMEPIIRKGLPVLFPIPDPMVIYADTNEDEDGVPAQVIVFYERQPWMVHAKYKDWTNPKYAGILNGPATVNWMEYWNEEERYFEADGEMVLHGKNPYKLNPWVHKLSGFGKMSPEGKLQDLIVGRLRKSRDLLTRECAITSDIDSTFHLFANRSIDVQPETPNVEIPANFEEEYEMGPGLIHRLPFGVKVERAVEMLPEQQVFQYYYSIQQQLDREDPLVMAGLPVGSSGRQDDISSANASRRYDTIAENTEQAFAVAFGMGLKILEKIPTLMPSEYGLSKNDINGYYEVNIELKAPDPIEADRKSLQGKALVQAGQLSLRTNLIKYQGMTEDGADGEIDQILAEKYMYENPDIAMLIGARVAEKAGMVEDIEQLKQQKMQEQGQPQMPPMNTENPRGGEPRNQNIKTDRGMEEADLAFTQKGVRSQVG